ncbi:MAG: diacylglycerol kinase [Candidatus Omnitrophica bacterium]|nr:diacylglycerol kinase [Candidatus Omnitrophota bacterium]
MDKRRLMDSFNYAIEGLTYVLKTQKNMRWHLLAAIIIVMLGLYYDLTKTELLLLFLTISLVFVTEMINTGVELIIDLITKEFHPLARIIKDVCAGAVLVASLNALFVGYILFVAMVPAHSIQNGINYIRANPLHISFFSLFLVLVIVIYTKLKFGRGKPLRGGMPSGHSALAFSMWIVAVFLAESQLVIFLVFILALLVAQSRIRPGYHSLKEVIAGAGVGIGVTGIIFMLVFRR